jgi:hypothetical protein
MLLGFETASANPRIVGINFVMPEDGYISMEDYILHMRVVGFLHNLYPKVHISLYTGELAPGLVPPEGLCCHIRQPSSTRTPSASATVRMSCTKIIPTTCLKKWPPFM